MIVSVIMVTAFGTEHADLPSLSLAAAAGFFTNAGVIGLFALVASSYPSAMRAGGTGFVIGIGRLGAAMGPILAGFLFQAGMDLPHVAMLIGTGSVAAALAVLALPRTGGPSARKADHRPSP